MQSCPLSAPLAEGLLRSFETSDWSVVRWSVVIGKEDQCLKVVMKT